MQTVICRDLEVSFPFEMLPVCTVLSPSVLDSTSAASEFGAKPPLFIILPEEDETKHFLVSLIVQQVYREMLKIADEISGKLPNRVMFLLDEFGTLPQIQSAEMMFSASRSRRISFIPIIQSLAQLEKNYGKDGW